MALGQVSFVDTYCFFRCNFILLKPGLQRSLRTSLTKLGCGYPARLSNICNVLAKMYRFAITETSFIEKDFFLISQYRLCSYSRMVAHAFCSYSGYQL